MSSLFLSSPTPNPKVLIPSAPHILSLLSRLHTQSLSQEPSLSVPGGAYSLLRSSPITTTTTETETEAEADNTTAINAAFFTSLVALDPDKAAFVYTLLLSLRATHVIEVGTSFGVSTIYIALAVEQNARAKAIKRVEGKYGYREGCGVIATEMEGGKIEGAKGNWKAAGKEVEKWIELREGDCRETLARDIREGVEFVLLDIWTPMVLPVVKLLEPKMKDGCVLVADNTVASKEGYKEFLEYVDREGSGYVRTTLPYAGGLEMIVYRGAGGQL